MIDANSQFFAILTNVGMAKQANADALGIPWLLTQMGVGDANPGGLADPPNPVPSASQTRLLNEWRRKPLNQLKIDPVNPAVIIAEQIIPADEGGKWIREIGLYDADGDLVAVANCAPSFKPLLSQGSGRTQIVRMNFIVTSTGNIQLKIDPSVVLATRGYVDETVVAGLARLGFKQSVRAAAPVAVVLSGLQTIDGVALVPGDRVLVPFQAAAKDNGIYVVAAGAWVRSADADLSAEVAASMLVPVEDGAVNGDSLWQLVTNGPIVLGTTALTFEMLAGPTGIVAGTYRSVTVDKKGRVTAGTNPNSLAGYEIAPASQAEAVGMTNDTKPLTPKGLGQALASAKGILRATVSGTLVIPPGISTIYASGCAGGGGGGSCPGGSSACATGGSGGGAGQSVMRLPIAVTQGQVIPYTVGAAGVGSANYLSPATAGGSTMLGEAGALLKLLGGGAGITGSNAAGAIGGPFGGVGYPSGSDADDVIPNNHGGAGGHGASGPFGGGGARSRGGSAGGGGTLVNRTAHGFGAGGGGAGGYYLSGSGYGSPGGNGSPGLLIIEW
ncbi:phage tail protein [Pseudomonas aphyarum]|uniref:Phage tail protein n=1 Tax=Pseudomonas aphyarum TaxID=2942629 RepID=A0ABT5PV76_9PSED|nr:phage tail protein [Pseudomonas aphyarum]MDD0969732.1 phage tail protein [Pseudomonas aphyarum]MDD1127812.1 phage tail protein [Pseudomonas aphyarum]